MCVSGAGDSLPDKEELATAHDVGRHPEGADGIRGHVRLYPNKFFMLANLYRCAQAGLRAVGHLRLSAAGERSHREPEV